MRNIWKLQVSMWSDKKGSFEDQYDAYYSSKKKAIEASKGIIKVVDGDTPKVSDNGPSFVAVVPEVGLKRHCFISRKTLA